MVFIAAMVPHSRAVDLQHDVSIFREDGEQLEVGEDILFPCEEQLRTAIAAVAQLGKHERKRRADSNEEAVRREPRAPGTAPLTGIGRGLEPPEEATPESPRAGKSQRSTDSRAQSVADSSCRRLLRGEEARNDAPGDFPHPATGTDSADAETVEVVLTPEPELEAAYRQYCRSLLGVLQMEAPHLLQKAMERAPAELGEEPRSWLQPEQAHSTPNSMTRIASLEARLGRKAQNGPLLPRLVELEKLLGVEASASNIRNRLQAIEAHCNAHGF